MYILHTCLHKYQNCSYINPSPLNHLSGLRRARPPAPSWGPQLLVAGAVAGAPGLAGHLHKAEAGDLRLSTPYADGPCGSGSKNGTPKWLARVSENMDHRNPSTLILNHTHLELELFFKGELRPPFRYPCFKTKLDAGLLGVSCC